MQVKIYLNNLLLPLLSLKTIKNNKPTIAPKNGRDSPIELMVLKIIIIYKYLC